LKGHVAPGEPEEIVASGVIIIRPQDFAKQLTTFRSTSPTPAKGIGAMLKFGVIFVQQLADAYLRRRSRARVAA
jgi:cholesterol oxidase